MIHPARIAVVACLSVAATLGFHGVFDRWVFLWPAVLGATIGTVVLLLAVRRRLYVGESVALSTVGFVLGGCAVAAGPAGFFDGIVTGWSHLLSSAPPVELTPELRVLPYAVAWVSVTIGGELCRRAAQPVLPVIGPVAGLAVTVLVSVEEPTIATVQGLAMALGALALGVLQRDTTPLSRRTSAMVLTALVALSAPLLGPRLPMAGANQRFDLRPYQDRPWDPLDQPSPLVGFKAQLHADRRNTPLFTITSDTPLTRWTSAVLGTYNGTVWAVADERSDAPAQFRPVDRRFPGAPATGLTYTIEMHEPSVWVPVAGRAVSIEPTDIASSPLRFNAQTGTVAAPDGLVPGASLSMTAAPLNEPEPADVVRSTASPSGGADLELVPPSIRNLAGDVFEGTDAGPVRARVLAARFAQQGFYDHGPTARPGHSLGRLDEFLAEPDRIIGFGEQYAAAAGLLAQLGGLPTRVAVGHVIPVGRYRDGRATVVADDAAAWIEILTVEHGWVPIDVTPDRTREPREESRGITVSNVAFPNPPPPPPPPPDTEPIVRPDSAEDDDPDDEATDDAESVVDSTGIPPPVVAGAIGVVVPCVLGSVLGASVMALKSARRRRRRRGSAPQRIAGAWAELIDGFAETGLVTTGATTPSETVHTLVRNEPAAVQAAEDLHRIAEHVDRTAFHPRPPDNDDATEAWRHCERALDTLRATRTRRQRLAMRTDPRPLTSRRTR